MIMGNTKHIQKSPIIGDFSMYVLNKENHKNQKREKQGKIGCNMHQPHLKCFAK